MFFMVGLEKEYNTGAEKIRMIQRDKNNTKP